MEIEVINKEFSVCKVKDYSLIDINKEFMFISKTDEENSLVCPSDLVPENTTDVEHGWKAMRITGVLDFSLVGILSKIASILAEEKIPVFVISTFNTDYILVKEDNLNTAIKLLLQNNYNIK